MTPNQRQPQTRPAPSAARDVVISNNQSGGITAHTVNIGTAARKIDKQVAETLVTRLRGARPANFELEVTTGAGEANQLGHVLVDLLKQGGWTCNTFAQSQFPFLPRHLIIQSPVGDEAGRIFVQWAAGAGLKPDAKELKDLDHISVIVGTAFE